MAPTSLARASRTRLYVTALLATLMAGAAGLVTPAQAPPPMALVASRNVNMVSGQELPNGDPYLQRQNEPSVAASTRNPLHLLAGANDYRTVDIPGSFEDGETGDAWMGVFKSFDGGERWQSTLLPGYPQDTSAEGMASPLKAYHAGADPVVRPGTNGLIYYSGLAFNRGEGGASAIFVSRFIDNNNKENGDPIAYLSTSLVATSSGAAFLDKPWMAVDVPRAGAKVCKIQNVQAAPTVKARKGVKAAKATGATKGKVTQPALTISQQVLAGTMYVAYASIVTTTVGGVDDVTARIMFSKSDDCGATWSKPQQISRPEDKVNQGATIGIDPRTGAVHVAWRQFGISEADPDAMMISSSASAGKTFDKPKRVHQFPTRTKKDQLLPKLKRSHRMGEVHELVSIKPFDSGTAEDRFRTNAYPTIAIDDESRVYLAWTERGYGAARPDAAIGDARIVLATSKAGAPWTTPRPIDTGVAGTDLPGHQMMPSMTFAGGRLVVAYYDLRQDVSQVFGPFVDENDAVFTANKRHTIDLRAAQAAKGDVPVFGPSTLVSQYMMGNLRGEGGVTEKQLQFNAPNLPLFQLGSVPFMGDYIDIAPAPAFVQSPAGQWTFNTNSTTAPVFHAVWTDNRDVQKPKDGDWKNYTPPGASACVPGQTGMRNQNVYSARLTLGLLTGSPGNTKPLDPMQPRAFVVFAQNTTLSIKSFRMKIAAQPTGGQASFDQIGATAGAPLLTTVDVMVAPRSMVTRTVYATSTNPKMQVAVDVAEIVAPTQPLVTGGLASRVILNPDISNPDISNPDISNPDISNPDISNAEVYNPDISNPDISNPDISNPDISNPDISNPDISNVRVANPDISNPDISNPDISNPDISNPDISNPDISNPDISNGTLTDVTWTVTNTGNTTAAFNVNLFLAQQAAAAGGIKTQLVVHKTYNTPVSLGCALATQRQTVLVANVLNPTFKAAGDATVFDPANPDISNTTLWLEPGGEGKITLRIVDPNPADAVTINPVTDLTPVVQADPVNTPELSQPNPEPPATQPPPAAAAPVQLAFVTHPVNGIANVPMAPVAVSAFSGLVPQAGVQVTLAIAVNPSAGHLAGTVTRLTDVTGMATFSGLSIERDGTPYQLSASASASGALPVLSNAFMIGVPAPPPSPFVVTNTLDTLTVGTLRNAITEANLTPAVDTITFAIPGPGPHTIPLLAKLPAIAQPVIIDGTTQPGYDGAPMIRVDGAVLVAVGFEPGAFLVNATSTIRGLMITRFTAGSGWGFWVSGAGAQSVIENNFIGTDRVGSAGLGNKGGVTVTFGVNDVVIRNNVVAGNAGFGMSIVGTARTSITGNRVGTHPDGLSALPNTTGILITNNSQDTVIDSNVISGNSVKGIRADVGTDPRIVRNTIGLGADGVTRLANSTGGIQLTATEGAVIGAPGEGNVISGNGVLNTVTPAACDLLFSGDGVVVQGVSTVIPVIQSNYIGTDATGEVAVPNLYGGVVLQAPARVGGAAAGEGNLISGNGCAAGGNGTGISIPGTTVTAGTVIQGNVIGLSKITETALGNGFSGITVNSPAGALIGGGAAGQGNVISGNPQSGVAIYQAGAAPPAGVVIRGNKIGTGTDGLTPKPNGAHGLSIGDAAGTIVGSLVAADGNLIAFNAQRGVLINGTSTGVTVLSNRIVGNGSMGIDLAPLGVTANDAGDGDAGANGLQNFPALTNVSNAGASTAVDLTLDSLQINANHTIQIFANTTCDASGSGEGDRLVKSFVQMSNGSGDIALAGVTLTELVPVGQFLTSTATDAAGNTSEFSQCVAVPAPPAPNPFIVTSTADTLTLGTLRNAITEANVNGDQNTITFAIPGAGPHTIALGSTLPPVQAPAVIDATTQPGWDGRPMVRVDGQGTAGHGFDLQAPATIKGLAITRFTAQAAVFLTGAAGGSIVELNHIGTDRTGAAGLGNKFGVWMNYTSSVIVRSNLLSSHTFSGIQVAGGSANEIRQNFIGTGLDGFGVLSNLDNGITMYDGANATVINGNTISGNGTPGGGNGWGIDIQHSGALALVTNTVITNNIIGLDAAGNRIDRGAAGGEYVNPGPGLVSMGPVNRGNAGGGIRVNRGSGTAIGLPGAGNTISGNTKSGVQISGAVGVPVTLRDNRIGTDPTGNQERGNRRGVEVFSGTMAIVGLAGAGNGNVISGNTGDGVTAGGNTTIENNLVGVDATGTVVMGNGNAQLLVGGVPQESGCCHSGITVTAPNNVVRGNVVGGSNANTQHPGIASRGAAGPPNVIEDNFVGVSASGAIALPNGVGVASFGSVGTIVRRNTLAHNLLAGAFLVENTAAMIFGGVDPADGNIIHNNPTGVIVGYNAGATEQVSILSNRIYDNTSSGIDLGFNGATANDAGDGDAGPNGLQNYPVLSNVGTNGSQTTVDFALDSLQITANHRIQVFANPACSVSEGRRLVGSFIQMTNGSGDASGPLTLTELVPAGEFLTATATDAAGNTSEFSACVIVPASATGNIMSASPANEAPGEGFMVLRGTNLPATIGDVVADVVSGPTTYSGFWFGGPSTSTAGYVRMPFGIPVGAATVRLRNGAGTQFTNAFPITISATPGTPVITEIRDGSLNVVVAPVPAGTTVNVGADGIDTTGAVVRFTQGANTWDVTGVASSNGAIGMTLQVNLPGDASTGLINVSIRQGASAFSAPVSISASNPGFIGPAGGPGGNPFGPVACNIGHVLTALTGEAGSYMGRFTMWCSPVLAGPSLGAPVATAVIGVAGVGPADFGAALTCPANHAITGIFGTAGNVGWGVVVDGLGVKCTDVATNAVFTSGMVGGAATTPFNFTCPAGDEGIGFAGAFGGVLDRIGIVCANRAAPAPVSSPHTTLAPVLPLGPPPARPSPLTR